MNMEIKEGVDGESLSVDVVKHTRSHNSTQG